jgi:hypothetical protein
MTAAGHAQVKGLAAHTLQATLFNDQALSNIRSVLDAAKGTGIAFACAANGATASATNPVYSGTIWCNGYTPVNGSIGEMATIDLSFDITTDVTIAVV